MRHSFHLVSVSLSILLIFGGASCYKDLAIKDPCSFDDVDIQIIPEAICAPDCLKTFNLTNITSLPGNTEFLWTLRRETEVLPLPDPTFADFEFEFKQGGMYSISVAVSFPDFSGCNFVLDTSFTIGVPPVQAVIEVNLQQCIVGDCDLTFEYRNEGDIADTWTWEFSDGDSGDYQNQQTVQKSFDICPDTIRVVLTAENQGGSDRDTMLIFVDPVTFDTTHDVGDGTLERIMCVRETEDGSFLIIGNTLSESYVARISRDGDQVTDYKVLPPTLPAAYTERLVLDCHQIGDENVLVGTTLRDLAGQPLNFDSYLLVVDNQFQSGFERAFRPDTNGNEIAQDITARLSGGYIVCGSKTKQASVGMLLTELDASYNRIDDRVIFAGNENHKAYGIVTVSDGYVVVGEVTNPATGTIQGCSFRLDLEYNVRPGTIRYYPGAVPNELIKIDEDQFIMLATRASSADIIAFGTVNWTKTLGDSDLSKGILTTDGMLVVTGWQKVGTQDAALIGKIDPRTGDWVFTPRLFPADGANRQSLAIDQTKENGFVAGGLHQAGGDKVLLIRKNHRGQDSPN